MNEVRRTELTKSAAVISLAVAVGFIAFNPLFKQSQHPDTLGFLAVLPLLWAALRRGPRDTAIASFILAGFSIWGTLSAAGPFAPASLNDAFLSVLVFLISVSVPSLALSADVAMALTGVAGPTEQDGQPVGTLFVGLVGPGFDDVRHSRLPGQREQMRQFAVITALGFLREHLQQR